jgi:hypothetical protein
MRPKMLKALACMLLLSALACGQRSENRQSPAPTPSATAAAAQPTPSATCRLLAAVELRELQGEEPTDAQGSEHDAGGFRMSQCFYRLPTFSKSVNLEVIRPAAGAQPDALKEFWRQRFHPKAVEAREQERERKEEREREREAALKRERERGEVREGGHKEESEKEREREEEESSRPRPVKGVGEEAYWSGNQINSALSVLGRGVVVRVSVGGPEETEAKIRKASELARKVLARL